ncbi:MAG: methionyl-tRNA formyltransferase [candidate division WOR-3 bacterium]|nr:MAG: methionyl-tRNA formyltransferase [candidate division WOR-3 bacterium]
MNIVFFGSGSFADPLLKELDRASMVTAIVVTKPKPAGRGRKPSEPGILHWARERNLTVFMPEQPNDENFIKQLKELKPDMFVLASYGHILSRRLLDVARIGGLNVHPSLLPQYRGAAPIQRALMDGASMTGVTIIMMDEKIDHGKIVFQKVIDIAVDDNYGSLLKKLCGLAVAHLIETVENVGKGTYVPIVQDESRKSLAPKIRKNEKIIDWQQDRERICNLVRALSPRPGAKTMFRDKVLTILDATPTEDVVSPGRIHLEQHILCVGTGSGSVVLQQVRPHSKRVMTARDFINGFHPREGEKIG